MALQPDGKIVVTGLLHADVNDTKRSFVVRYLPDGTPDNSFGDKGTVITVFQNVIEMNDITVQPDGKIITGGTYGYLFQPQFLLVRYR